MFDATLKDKNDGRIEINTAPKPNIYELAKIEEEKKQAELNKLK